MNFIEAHEIVHKYAEAIGKGHDGALLCRPISTLTNTPEEITIAHKIFLAHVIMFKTRTKEEFDKYITCYRFLPTFVDDDLYNKMIYLENITEKKTLYYKLFHKSNIINARKEIAEYNSILADKYLYSDLRKDIDDFVINAEEAFYALYNKIKKNDRKMNSEEYFYLLENYCEKVYELIGVEECSESDILLFQDFNTLRDWIKNGTYCKYLNQYHDYIMKNN